MKLSSYAPSQNDAISQLFERTFSDSEGEAEGKTIGQLANALLTTTDPTELYCFIATDESQIIGSIIFTRLSFDSGENAFILSPVAVHTEHQGKGIGQKLISFGLEQLKADGIELAFTYGDPNFYGKVGFAQVSEEIAKAPLKLSYPHGWLAQSLTGKDLEPISGASSCVNALNNQDYW